MILRSSILLVYETGWDFLRSQMYFRSNERKETSAPEHNLTF